MLSEVLFPSALPYILTGLRVGIGRGLVGVVVAEFFFSSAGLGYEATIGGQMFNMALILGSVFVLAVVGVVFTALTGALTARLMPWRAEELRQR